MSRHVARGDRVLAALAAQELAALVVTHPANVRYLTGYVGSNGIAVLAPGGRRLITDGRYATSARAQVEGADVVIGERDLLGALAEACRDLAPDGPVGVEAEHVTLARHERIQDAVRPIAVRPTSGIVEGLRVHKDHDEIALIAEAARIADQALASVIGDGLAGRTERRVALAIGEALVDAGAEGPSFDVIVAGGPRGALPHAVPTAAAIPSDTLVVIDLGARHHGYCSDLTRTVPVGRPPADLARAYDVCLAAQRAALAAVAPGIGAADLDAVARAVVEDAGLGDCFVHGLGHGVGLEVHERPGVRKSSRETLAAGMVLTVEPGIYVEGVGGVRIEDLVLVTEDGHRLLSAAPAPRPPALSAASRSSEEGG